MAKIKAPNKEFNGTSAGVNFRDGEGETTDPWKLQWFKEHGYEISDNKKGKAKEDESSDETPKE